MRWKILEQHGHGMQCPFYVVFQIIGSYFCLFDIKNQTIGIFFCVFLKAYNTLSKENLRFPRSNRYMHLLLRLSLKTLLDNLLLVDSIILQQFTSSD